MWPKTNYCTALEKGLHFVGASLQPEPFTGTGVADLGNKAQASFHTRMRIPVTLMPLEPLPALHKRNFYKKSGLLRQNQYLRPYATL